MGSTRISVVSTEYKICYVFGRAGSNPAGVVLFFCFRFVLFFLCIYNPFNVCPLTILFFFLSSFLLLPHLWCFKGAKKKRTWWDLDRPPNGPFVDLVLSSTLLFIPTFGKYTWLTKSPRDIGVNTKESSLSSRYPTYLQTRASNAFLALCELSRDKSLIHELHLPVRMFWRRTWSEKMWIQL